MSLMQDMVQEYKIKGKEMRHQAEKREEKQEKKRKL
jgi:hypothetical protein